MKSKIQRTVAKERKKEPETEPEIGSISIFLYSLVFPPLFTPHLFSLPLPAPHSFHLIVHPNIIYSSFLAVATLNFTFSLSVCLHPYPFPLLLPLALLCFASPMASLLSKRKRTKRPRSSSPSTSSSEEEDMAHCLILLAQGPSPSPSPASSKFTSRKFAETTTTSAGAKAGFYVYECKTCSKRFSSFQALGGHRASHKKPRLAANSTTSNDDDDDNNKITKLVAAADDHASPLPMPNTNNNNNKKMMMISRQHECSVCGAEFSSGQALGGHMRRHRPILAAAATTADDEFQVNKERNLLSLDLNLPAPAEEALSFSMLFSPQLVDCHY